MWIHSGRLEHVLSPDAYVARAQHDAEVDRLFRPTWHCVGLGEELRRDGDQRAFELFGTPVLLRRGQGELRAFVNVCVHRHSLLVREGTSRADAVVCPYHGFRYREDGALDHVPDATSFRGGGDAATPPLGRLRSLAVARAGELVFVSLEAHPAPLAEHLDAETRAVAERAFSAEHRLVRLYRFEASCNWKVALENVLETYHVDSLHGNALARHPQIFRLFTGTLSGPTHRLGERSTSYYDSMGADSKMVRRFAEALRPGAHARYEHLHAFPALVLAHTHLVSFVQTVTPLGPERCLVEARLLATHATPLARAAAPWLGPVAARFMDMVLREDASVYERVQRGLRSSPHRGVLSAREERIHAFQCHVRDRAGDVGRPR